jgi:hypothetical protein
MAGVHPNRTTEINVDVRSINVGYRQSQKLRELSDALAALLDGDDRPETEPSKGSDEANAWPLLGQGLTGKASAEWLAARIGEVEDAVGRLFLFAEKACRGTLYFEEYSQEDICTCHGRAANS